MAFTMTIPERIVAQSKTTFVYVVGPEHGPWKVGVAANVKRRVFTLQTGSPQMLTVAHQVAAPMRDAYFIERAAHRSLSASAIKGEWFGAPLAEVIAAVDAAARAASEDQGAPDMYAHVDTRRAGQDGLRRLFTDGQITEVAYYAGLRLRSVMERLIELQSSGKGGADRAEKVIDDRAWLQRVELTVRGRLGVAAVQVLRDIVAAGFSVSNLRGKPEIIRQTAIAALDIVSHLPYSRTS